jgi:hypothetical protein
MAGFKLEGFRGLRPRVAPRLLGQGEATVSSNVRLGSGALDVWRGGQSVANTVLTNPASLYRYENDGAPLWLEWPTDVDVARSPVEEDELDRIYFTGAPDDPGNLAGLARPKMTWKTFAASGGSPTNPKSWRYMGVPAPASSPVATPGALQTPVLYGGLFRTKKLLMSLSYNIGTWPGNAAVSDWLEINTVAATTEYAFDGFAPIISSGVAPLTELEVTGIVDANYVTVRNKANIGYIAITTAPNAVWARQPETGKTHQIGGGARFFIPDGAELAVPGHNLKVGNILKVTSEISPGRLFFNDNDRVYDAEAWGAPDGYVSGGSFLYTHNQRAVWRDDTGTAFFNCTGAWWFEVRRGNADIDLVESRAYVYTYVTSLNEEGPPSAPSTILEVYDGDTVSLSGLVNAASPYTSYITKYRIYRTSTGIESTDYLFVKEIDAGTATTTEAVTNTLLGAVLSTTEWDPPPDAHRGIVALPNGSLAGFIGNQVWFSEPYYPHAWPYKKQIDANIIGLAVFSTSLLVLTDRTPYVLTGAHPRQMAPRQVDFEQPCLSKRGVVVVRDTVIYPSPDGLAAIGSGGAELVTEPYMTKREWAAYQPSQLRAAVLDQAYYGVGPTKAFIFDPGNPTVGLSDLTLVASTILYEPLQDALFYVSGTTIRKWDAVTESPLTYTWRSQVLRCEPLNMACGRVVADSYPVTFSLYKHGELVATRTVNNDDIFRLPSGYLATEYQVAVTAATPVHLIHISDSVAELMLD